MRKLRLRLIALCLVVCLLLTGCGMFNFGGYFQNLFQLLVGGQLTPFSQMEYSRPDMTDFDAMLENCCQQAETEKNISQLQTVILEFYGFYDTFYTGYALAMIHYTKNMTDPYWQAEYNFCTENASRVDAGLDRLYRALAKSPLRKELETDAYFGPGFFEKYEGESLYDEVFTQLLQQEAALQNEYYRLSGESAQAEPYSEAFFTTYGAEMAQLFVELVRVRQQQAEHAGYDSYPEFAYDFYHARDYSVQEAAAYMADIRAQLVPLYRQMVTRQTGGGLPASSEAQTLEHLRQVAAGMGGVFAEAFRDMERFGLYDISYSTQKFDASYEIFLRDYYTPYIFVNPTGTAYDKLSFTHEFGHFCADYASGGSGAGVDVAEVFSQGMEYLSLFYVEDPVLEQLRLQTCLSTYVEQAAYASFEHQVYSLEGEKLTVDSVQALYTQVGQAYGFDSWAWDSRDYVCVSHFFTSPLYVISYVVSNDAAFQLYQLELDSAGTGLQRLENSLQTRQAYILAFLEEAGLTSPFADGRLEQVAQTLSAVLLNEQRPATTAGLLLCRGGRINVMKKQGPGWVPVGVVRPFPKPGCGWADRRLRWVQSTG